MESYQTSKMIRVYLNEGDRFHGKPLYEAVVDRCRAMKIAGATVFRGSEGFGDTAEIHRSHVLTHDSPVMITIVDTSDNIERIVPQLEEIVDSGLIVSSDVLVRRVNRGSSGTEHEASNAAKE